MVSKGNDRLAPPLMYAFRAAHDKRDAKLRLDLRDEAGERVIATRRVTTRQPDFGIGASARGDDRSPRASQYDEPRRRRSICPTMPAVRSSILNFGFPDLSWRTIDENSLNEISREIEVALADFEPRLARNSIQARSATLTTSAEELKLRFLVRADLRAQPVNVPVEFVAEVELDSGKIKIDRL